MRLIDADALPLRMWTRTAQYFQDDIVASVETAFMENVAEAENAFLFDMIRAIREAPTINIEGLRRGKTMTREWGTIKSGRCVCKKCGESFNTWEIFQKKCPKCGYDGTMTNGDRIRNMADEELQEWLCGIMTAEACDMTCPGRDMCVPGHAGLEDWLKQEARNE